MEERIRIWFPDEQAMFEMPVRDAGIFNEINEDIIIMQCTGLKVKTANNKKKVLLYEGDTVSTNIMFKADGVIKWGNGRFYVEYKDGHTLSFIAENLNDIVKTGDIYRKKLRKLGVLTDETPQTTLGI